MATFEEMIRRNHEQVSYFYDEDTGLRCIIGVDNTSLKSKWDKIIDDTLEKAKLNRPKDSYMATGSKKAYTLNILVFC